MTDEKGLSPEVADKIGEYVKLKGQSSSKFLPTTSVMTNSRTGGPSLLDQLKTDETLMSNPNAKDGILEMELLFTLLAAYNVLDKVLISSTPNNVVHPHPSTDFFRHVARTRSRLLHRNHIRGDSRSLCTARVHPQRTHINGLRTRTTRPVQKEAQETKSRRRRRGRHRRIPSGRRLHRRWGTLRQPRGRVYVRSSR